MSRHKTMDYENLIELVSEYPCLYNPEDIRYKDKILRDAAWESVALQINEDPKLCKKYWNNLFLNYHKYLIRIKENKQVNKGKNWELYQKMEFLAGVLSGVEPKQRRKPRHKKKKNAEDIQASINQSEIPTLIEHTKPTENSIVVGIHTVVKKHTNPASLQGSNDSPYRVEAKKHTTTEPLLNGTPYRVQVKKHTKTPESLEGSNSSPYRVELKEHTTTPETLEGLNGLPYTVEPIIDTNLKEINKESSITNPPSSSKSFDDVSLDNMPIIAKRRRLELQIHSQNTQNIIEDNANQNENSDQLNNISLNFFANYIEKSLQALPPSLRNEAIEKVYNILERYTPEKTVPEEMAANSSNIVVKTESEIDDSSSTALNIYPEDVANEPFPIAVKIYPEDINYEPSNTIVPDQLANEPSNAMEENGTNIKSEDSETDDYDTEVKEEIDIEEHIY